MKKVKIKQSERQNAKKHLVILLVCSVIIMLALSACARRTSERPRTVNKRAGNEGLKLRFLPQTPPSQVYATDPAALRLIIELRNIGAEDIHPNSDLDLRVIGYDPNIIGLAPKLSTAAISSVGSVFQFSSGTVIEGRDEFFPEGGFQIAEWDTAFINMPPNLDRLQQTFIVNACYTYRTIASPVVCIDPDPFSASAVAQEKPCYVRDIGMAGGQGGPVAVTSVEEQILPTQGQVQFKINIRNTGNGVLFADDQPTQVTRNSGAFTRCTAQRLSVSDLNKVYVEQVTIAGLIPVLSNGPSTCNPNPVILTNGQGFTYCTFAGINPGNIYETPLEIVLNYGYKTSAASTVQILRTPGTGR